MVASIRHHQKGTARIWTSAVKNLQTYGPLSPELSGMKDEEARGLYQTGPYQTFFGH